jgi:hypothetical protein
VPRVRKAKAVSFNFFGSKIRFILKILAQAAITSGGKFIDCCAGRGNFTWQAWAKGFQFSQWVINDIRMTPFFEAIREIGHNVRVPPRSRAEFEKQRLLAAKGDQQAIALESWLAYNGGLYGGGGGKHCNNGHRSSGGRKTPAAEEANMRLANKVLREMKPKLTSGDWLSCLEAENPGPRDLVVYDGPYIGFDVGAYADEEILPLEVRQWFLDHTRTPTNSTNWTNWILCEGRQSLYLEAFGEPAYQRKVRSKKTGKTRIECVWTSESAALHLANRDAVTLQAKPVPIRGETCYARLSAAELLKEIKESIGNMDFSRLIINAEERRRLLPALRALRKITYRKKPGYYASLRSIGLTGDRVRQIFYRSHTTDEVIGYIERPAPKTIPVRRKGYPKLVPDPERAEELWDAYIYKQHLEKLVAAVLADKITYAKRLATEYVTARDENNEKAA